MSSPFKRTPIETQQSNTAAVQQPNTAIITARRSFSFRNLLNTKELTEILGGGSMSSPSFDELAVSLDEEL